MNTAICPSCDKRTRSAATNPDGLCTTCRGKQTRVSRNGPFTITTRPVGPDATSIRVTWQPVYIGNREIRRP